MARRKDFKKANTYTGQKLKGEVTVSYKIDGVRILFRDGEYVTRNNKVPPGLDSALTDGAKEKIEQLKDCEVYKNSFFESNSPMQRHHPEKGCIREEHIYPLESLDQRLIIETVEEPTKEFVAEHLKEALKLGYEGLVLRTRERWYRVKPESTADVRVTGWFEQMDKHGEPKGQLGGFTTNYGRITAFKEEARQELWDDPEQYVGDLIEVQYKELYDTGKFRYAVKFLRFRTDKDEESFDA
tara:strand:- start:6814 stop:7536 length:723 start_codon:yes stop_codon:yes gene_type:complete